MQKRLPKLLIQQRFSWYEHFELAKAAVYHNAWSVLVEIHVASFVIDIACISCDALRVLVHAWSFRVQCNSEYAMFTIWHTSWYHRVGERTSQLWHWWLWPCGDPRICSNIWWIYCWHEETKGSMEQSVSHPFDRNHYWNKLLSLAEGWVAQTAISHHDLGHGSEWLCVHWCGCKAWYHAAKLVTQAVLMQCLQRNMQLSHYWTTKGPENPVCQRSKVILKHKGEKAGWPCWVIVLQV